MALLILYQENLKANADLISFERRREEYDCNVRMLSVVRNCRNLKRIGSRNKVVQEVAIRYNGAT